jgi:hypothetical protein
MIVNVGDKEYYMKPNLVSALNKIKKKVLGKDADYVIVVDGFEGSGKSVFAMQIGKYLDNSLGIDDICMNPEEFKRRIETAPKNKCIIFDEAFHGLSSRQSLSTINKLLVSKMMMMRQKNLFVIIVLPTFFLLDRYVSLFRSKVLFHIYENKDVHYWLGFNQKNKKLLYLLGRKTMTYTKPRIWNFKGQFMGKYTVDEAEYRAKKMKALETSGTTTEFNKFMIQRDILIKILVKEKCLSMRKAEKYFYELGFVGNMSLSRQAISNIMRTGDKSQASSGASI